MADSSKFGGLTRRPRLTYANVMSTLAFFVALGGSSYAAVEINGSQIRDRSISGDKLKLHAVGARELNTHGVVVPRAQISDQTVNLLVPASRSATATAAVAGITGITGISGATGGFGPPCATGGLVALSAGQSCVMFTQGPFTIAASCTDAGAGNYVGDVSATSTEDGWYAFPGPGTALPAGSDEILAWSGTSPGSEVIGGPGPLVSAPDGTALSFTYVRMFVHEPFADCGIATNAIG